ncbi:hypothetical protein IF1G_08035 [Cordyceps javanica]|uniref:Uncharacterized protein n=1 Tax=Cordyceps javanica TaxID=43265 RepID=A0A545UVG5_9HYPO|nr:hypothetical protein IF1G_08035 [Cordyceps javanica]
MVIGEDEMEGVFEDDEVIVETAREEEKGKYKNEMQRRSFKRRRKGAPKNVDSRDLKTRGKGNSKPYDG